MKNPFRNLDEISRHLGNIAVQLNGRTPDRLAGNRPMAEGAFDCRIV